MRTARAIVTLRRRPRLRGFLAEGFGDPIPWEQVGELRLRRVGHTGENVCEPRLWIDIVELGGLDERVHEGGALGAALRSGE